MRVVWVPAEEVLAGALSGGAKGLVGSYLKFTLRFKIL